ncbi:hypothetical protein [Streptomyces albidoflavus]|uniref:hypothetical protein n=1 Tax=Streptomyces albidoflavus TaxID=1886 RepID=UPI0033AE2DEB
MSVEVIMLTEFPEGYTVFFGADAKVIMAPRSLEHSSTIRSLQIDTLALGRHAKVTSDVYLDFPADENSAPDLAILCEDAHKQGKHRSGRRSHLHPEPGRTAASRNGGRCALTSRERDTPACQRVGVFSPLASAGRSSTA